ncbi:MAG TPA: SGNH/GDSL hydrolase family protein [Thermoanaerobaculia bacterium]|nr:SGNH/GDSL hydrolase family protein [Thermoanaerobaculia bacterium]
MFRPSFKAALLGLTLLIAALPAAAQVDTGQANFNIYVAVGDSLTAGVASGGLVQTVQRNSYPILIYRQATGRTTGFEQPLISEPGIPALLELRSLVPLVIAQRGGQGTPLNLTLPRPYNNLGVPGAKIHDVRVTVTGGLHDAILRGLGSQLQQAVALHPTFVTLWAGNNDALSAALAGRVIEGVTLTPLADFTADYQAVVSALSGAGARLAIANIPDVTSIPFVTTLPPVVINPQTQQPVIVNGNPVPLIGPNGLLTAGDRVLLTAQAELATGRGIPAVLGGTGQPLSDGVVLSASEVSTINNRVAAFNTVIRAEATRVNAAFIDTNAVLRRAADTGISVGGITFTENFLTGGIFSLDGVHPTPFGYAYIANQFIAAINDQFDAEIPPVNLFPFVFGGASAAGSATAQKAEPQGIFTPLALKNLFWLLRVPDLDDQPSVTPPRRRRGRG